MKKFLFPLMILGLLRALTPDSFAQNDALVNGASSTPSASTKQAPQSAITEAPAPCGICTFPDSQTEYTVGVGDILDISVLQPQELTNSVTVSPDGSITFPYIGKVMVKGRTIPEIQEEIQTRLADGYLKYPIVTVTLKESLSRNFFVYGEVVKPGSYPMEENMTVLRAISMAGGFTKFGSSSRVKVLRAKNPGVGYETILVNIKRIMDGDSDEDVRLKQGDIVSISEGVF